MDTATVTESEFTAHARRAPWRTTSASCSKDHTRDCEESDVSRQPIVTPSRPLASVVKLSAAVVGLGAAAYGAYAALAWLRYGRVARARSDEADPLLDRFLLHYDVVERHAIPVAAPAQVVLDAARQQPLFSIPLVRWVFRGRELVMRSTLRRARCLPACSIRCSCWGGWSWQRSRAASSWSVPSPNRGRRTSCSEAFRPTRSPVSTSPVTSRSSGRCARIRPGWTPPSSGLKARARDRRRGATPVPRGTGRSRLQGSG